MADQQPPQDQGQQAGAQPGAQAIDPQAFANAVAQAVQAVLQQQAQVQQPAVQQAAQPGPFARAPALAIQGVIDYSTAAGAKIFSKATAPMDTTFSLQNPSTRVLLEELTLRGSVYGWDNVLIVETGVAPNQVNRNMLTDHVQITMDECKAKARTYINQQTRETQNDFQLYSTLLSSVDAETKKTMANQSTTYHVGTPKLPSGLLYLKTLLTKAELDTRAVGAHIRGNLAKLDVYMEEVAKYNITQFNDYVRDQVSQLTARGEQSTDLLTNLFNGYLACGDEKFCKYIENIKDQYEEGQDLEWTNLMTRAENKYKARILTDEWNQPSKEQEQIIALHAQISAMKRSRTGKGKSNPTAPVTPTTPNSQASKSGKDFKGKWAWRNTKPKVGESHTKTFEEEQWHFCTHHGYWVKHTSADCRLKTQKAGNKPDEPPTVDLNAALAAATAEDLTFEEDDDTDEE